MSAPGKFVRSSRWKSERTLSNENSLAAAAVEQSSIQRVAVQGVLWTAMGTVSRQVLQIVTSIILARLLAPDAFGLVAMALVVTELAQIVIDFGFGLAVVQSREATQETLSSCFWLSAGTALVIGVALTALSHPVAGLYKEPRIAAIMPFFAFNLLLSSALAVPQALLQRRMQFATLAAVLSCASFVGSAVTVGLAWSGFGIWALVTQPLAGTGALLVLLFATARWCPRAEFSWSAVRAVMRFSGGLFGSRLLNYLNRNGDNFLIGRFLGSAALGYYNLAYTIMLYPLGQVSGTILKVAFPMLVHLKGDMSQYRHFYLRACSAIALVTFPMMCGLFVVADQFVSVVFGSKWLVVSPLIKIFCPLGMLQSIGTTVGVIYTSTGRTHIMFLWEIVATPLILISFVVGLPWGINGVAICYAIVSVLAVCASMFIALRVVAIPMGSMLASLRRPLVCALLMAVCVRLSDSWLVQGVAAPQRLLCDVIIGAATYLILCLAINRREFLSTILAMKLSMVPASTQTVKPP